MAPLKLVAYAGAALVIGGCDVSQKTPQTESTSVGAPRTATATHANAVGERSMRGPGVSRKRHTRV